jgi:hypothetical protein
MIASSYPQLGWLAPAAAPDASSPDLQELKAIELKAMSTDLAAVRQSVDQLAAQFVARQEEMRREITELHATEQDILANILDKISAPPPRPAPAPVRKPVALTPAPLTPPPATQAPR